MFETEIDVTTYDFLDYPTGFAIQQQLGFRHRSVKCSAYSTNGAFLCDCGAIILDWQQKRAALGLSADGYEDSIPEIPFGDEPLYD